MKKEILCIACSIYNKEIDSLRKDEFGDIDFLFLDSMYHMRPAKLNEVLSQEINKYAYKNIVLLYGDCHANMEKMEAKSNVIRVPGINCINIILGDKSYKSLRREGAFILMEEWVRRWKEVFQKELGFKTSDSAKLFMREMHTKLVYLDTKVSKVPHDVLKDISGYCGLPYEIENCNIEELKNNIRNVIVNLKENG